jgi:hypothetical protein
LQVGLSSQLTVDAACKRRLQLEVCHQFQPFGRWQRFDLGYVALTAPSE